MTIVLTTKEPSCTVICEWKGARYRLTLNDVDPSMREAVQAAAASFFEALDSNGDLSKMGKNEKVPFRITSQGMEVKNNPAHSETARKITQIFSNKDLADRKRELASFGKKFNQHLQFSRSLALQELPNVGNTCFFNSAINAMAHPTLFRELLKYPEAFITSKAKAAALQDPESWPCCEAEKERTREAKAYRQYLHRRAQENPALFEGGAHHPFYKVLLNYNEGYPISAEEMHHLIDRLVLDQKCTEQGIPFGLGRFSAYEQLDPGDTWVALRSQIDCNKLKELAPHLVSSKSQGFSTETLKKNPAEQIWIPIEKSDDQCFPEVEIEPAQGLIEGLRNRLYDADPDSVPLRRGGETFVRKAQKDIFQTVPFQLIIGLSQTVFEWDRMSEKDAALYLATLRTTLEKLGAEERPVSLEELEANPVETVKKIFAELSLFQTVNHLIEEEMKKRGQRMPYIPVKKRHAPLGSVPLSFKTPPWFSESREEAELELTGFSFHQGGAGGGHYWAYARRGDRFFEVDDRTRTATPPREISQQEFLQLATRARKLIYTKVSKS